MTFLWEQGIPVIKLDMDCYIGAGNFAIASRACHG